MTGPIDLDKARRARRGQGPRPTIAITTDEQAVADAAIAALEAASGTVYVRGGMLVHVVTDQRPGKGLDAPPGAPRIRTMPRARLRELLSDAADWVKVGAKGDPRPAHPPEWCVGAVEARGEWPRLRYLEGVVEYPVIRPDGSLLVRPGYDPATGLLYQPNGHFGVVPDQPSRDDAVQARLALEDPFRDFPFRSAAHLSATVAGVLTLLARFSFSGPVPLFGVNKNVRGAGGSLLAEAVSHLVRGRTLARMAQAEDDAEARKRILSIALGGEPVVLIDNVDAVLGGAALEGALTATEIQDRILGKSELVTAPLSAVWWATGNNLQYTGDCLRRVLPIELESPEERPELRSGFAYPDLIQHVSSARPGLVAAGLTLLRAWFVAGQPEQGLPPWGSFEAWSRVVRNALVWAGGTDPADARQELQQGQDTEAQSLISLLEAMSTICPPSGLSGAALLERINEGEDTDAAKEAIGELVRARGPITPRSLGYALRRYKRRVIAGMRLKGEVTKQGIRWSVERLESS